MSSRDEEEKALISQDSDPVNVGSLVRFTKSKQRSSRFVVPYNHPYRIKWDMLIALLAFVNVITLPLFSAFFPDVLDNNAYVWVNYITDVIFWVDIVVGFRTTYINVSNGDEITDQKKIALRYLKGKFIFDLLAVFPVEILEAFLSGSTENYIYLRLLKMTRIFRLQKVLMYIRAKKEIKLTLRMLMLISALVVYTHLIACIWRIIVEYEESWEVPSLPHLSFYALSTFEQYIFCMYIALFIILGIESNPITTIETAFAAWSLIIGALLIAYFFGEIVVTIQDLQAEERKYLELQDEISSALINFKVSEELQREVWGFVSSSYSILNQQGGYEELTHYLPPSLQSELNKFVYKGILELNSDFLNRNVVEVAMQHFESRFVKPELEVVKQFDKGTEIYYIAQGSCEVYVQDHRNQSYKVAYLKKGDFFGEIGCLFEARRSATVVAYDNATLAVLSREHFLEILSYQPSMKKRFIERIAGYRDNYSHFLKRSLRRVPYFAQLKETTLVSVLYSLSTEIFTQGKTLVKSGEEVSKSYIVLEGTLQLEFSCTAESYTVLCDPYNIKKSSKKVFSELDRKLKALYKFHVEEVTIGSVINSRKLLFNAKTYVSCKASSYSRVLCIKDTDLKDLEQDFPDLRDSMKEVRNSLMIFDNFRYEFIPKLIVFDVRKTARYEKHLISLNSYEASRRCKLLNKFKIGVLNTLVTKRNSRKKLNVNIAGLRQRVNAVMQAETKEFYELANLIAQGKVPPDAAELAGSIEERYLGNPLIAQFALTINSANQQVEPITKMYKDLQKRTQSTKNTCKGLQESIENLQDMFQVFN